MLVFATFVHYYRKQLQKSSCVCPSSSRCNHPSHAPPGCSACMRRISGGGGANTAALQIAQLSDDRGESNWDWLAAHAESLHDRRRRHLRRRKRRKVHSRSRRRLLHPRLQVLSRVQVCPPTRFQTSRRSTPLQLPLRYFRVGLRALCAGAAMQRRRCTAQADVSRRRSDKVRPSPARHQRWPRLVRGCVAGAVRLTR